MNDGSDVRDAARRVNDSPATGGLTRLGYLASGVLHVMLGVIAIQVAWFHSPTTADQSGAFAALARHPVGALALVVVAVGFAGLAVWNVTEAVGSARGVGDRAKAASKSVVYGVLAWTAVGFAWGTPSSAEEQSRDFTASLLTHPRGRFAVAAVGVVVLGVAVYHVHKGWTRKFLQDLVKSPSRFVTAAGRVGYVARGIALALVGGLFVAAGVRARPDEAGGLDTALRTLGEENFGAFLLTVIAVGLVAYGVYSFARARWTRT